MMKRVIENKHGMALVVALLTSFILLALVASLFWVIASTSRQAEYAKNSAIALNLAEAGTADAIYRLNYCTGIDTGLYPFAGSLNPFGTSSFVTLPNNFLTAALFPGLIPIGITGTFPETGGVYYVGLQDITDNTGPDTLVAVGVYKGIRRVLTVSLRGNNNALYARQAASGFPAGVTQGISEAFNKHVIYADAVTVIGLGTTVYGNIVYTKGTPPAPFGINTKTLVDTALFEVCTPVPVIVFPPSPLAYDFYLKNGYGYADPACTDTDFYCIGQPVADDAKWGPVSAITYNPGSDYTIGDTGLSASYFVYDNNNLIIDMPAPTSYIANSLGTSTGNIEINSNLNIYGPYAIFTLGGATFTIKPGVTITGLPLSSGLPTGALKINSTPYFLDLTIPDSTIFSNAAVMCDKRITISGAITINNGGSSDAAAILSFGTPASITVNGAITVNSLGPTQNFILLSCDPVSTVNAANIIINSDIVTFPGWRGTVAAAYSTAGDANIVIGVSVAPQLNGIVYAGSYGDNSKNATITLTNGTVTGSLVAGGTASDPSNRAIGTIYLNDGTLNYVPFVFESAISSRDIFPGFSGGRRAYVPTWQGWRLR